MSRRFVPVVGAVAAIVAVVAGTPASAQTHADLVSLYKQARTAVTIPVRNHAPDVSAASIAARAAAAGDAVRRIGAIDDSRWPVPQRVDLMIALAEMRGVMFEHRTLRPWARDPVWWSTLDLGWGPKAPSAISLPKLPIANRAERDAFAAKVRAVPGVLAMAQTSLVDLRGDLAKLGIAHHRIEARVYRRLAEQLKSSDPSLARELDVSARASDTFTQWLEAQLPRVPAKAGIGKAEFDWYLRYVLLYPWTTDEMLVLGEREWERSMSFLAIEEHEHRQASMIAPVTTLEGFESLRREADTELLAFLKTKKIFTVPDWLTVPPAEGPYVMPANQDPAAPGPFDSPVQRNFFREAEDRDPRTLRAHNLPGHIFDSAYQKRDQRPLRGGKRLGFLDSGRLEGWAFYLEEMVLQAGWLDDRPKAREIHYVLQANRAARLRAELLVQSNEWTFDQALASLTSRTPKWMELTDDTAIYDMALYLRQPGLGLNYYFGKLQIEQLLAEERHAKGDAFDLTAFHDRFISAGVIPIALIRWEMTGNDDQVRRMR